MRIALLSAGPVTLARYPGPEAYDLVVAVNTAATLHLAHWWSCADDDRFRQIKPLGRPHWFVMAPERDKVLAHAPEQIAEKVADVVTWEDIRPEVNPPNETMSWSCPAALVLARWCGATAIDCFGVDMVGEVDCLGQRAPHRNGERWKREREHWDRLVGWLHGLGVQVTREEPTADEIACLHPD